MEYDEELTFVTRGSHRICYDVSQRRFKYEVVGTYCYEVQTNRRVLASATTTWRYQASRLLSLWEKPIAG